MEKGGGLLDALDQGCLGDLQPQRVRVEPVAASHPHHPTWGAPTGISAGAPGQA